MSKNNTTNITSEGASKKLVPELRFPEFVNEGEWEIVILGDIFERVTDKNKENCQNVVTISAQHGLVSQYDYFNKNVAAANVINYYLIKKGDFAYNKSRSQGYPFGAIKQLRYYDKGVVSTLYICFRLIDNNGIKDFYDQYFETPLINSEIGKLAQEGARNHGLLNISTEDFFDKISLFIPSQIEQQKIAQCLSSLDELIAATKEKVELLKEHKRGLMQKLFPAKGKTLPELRFPEFNDDGEWKYVPMCRISRKITDKYKSDKTLPVLTNSASSGVVKQQDYFDREIVTKSNLDNYQILDVDDFVYNPRISSIAPVGPISRNNLTKGIMSPLYTVFRFHGGDKEFLEHFFNSNSWHDYIKKKANFGARYDRINISTDEFFGLPIPLPSIAEQKKIASVLSFLDDMIEQYIEKVNVLELHKKGLMQKLFPQK